VPPGPVDTSNGAPPAPVDAADIARPGTSPDHATPSAGPRPEADVSAQAALAPPPVGTRGSPPIAGTTRGRPSLPPADTGANGRPNGHGPGPTNGNGHAPANGQERTSGCTAPQLRRFIKSRPYVPMHELRRRFAIDGDDDDVTQVSIQQGNVYVGLPSREGSLLGELLRGGEIGYELSLDPRTPVVVGVYPMRPIPRS
jgi:hypothetical protein